MERGNFVKAVCYLDKDGRDRVYVLGENGSTFLLNFKDFLNKDPLYVV